ncbi:PKD domain-containing protein [Haloglomus salinum]|uniref:PKD domain-containing protein n=1 Tax=Haloglomus salinum TaxID=2962673 RepID=UPI0020C94CFF|nr:hypothetical protein [Haloglomus salinum]
MEPGGQGARWDGRAQAIQLGALLLFAILIINLSLFQIFVVPDQNGEIEFKHSEQVRSDMLDARNAVLDAATGDQSFVEVDLAPAYPSRSLFVNPAEPSGTIRTTEAREITIINDSVSSPQTISNNACPGASVPETRALEYRAGYNYYDSDPTYRVENTVLFREFPDETLPGSGQQLVTDDSINLLPLRNEFSESGTGAATVEPVPGGVLSTNVVDPEIQLPTAYSEDVWEDKVLDGTVPTDDIDVTDGTLTLTLSGSYQLNCGPIGLNDAPPSGARSGSLLGSGSGSGGGGSINPAGFSEVRLVSMSDVGSNSDVQVTLKNTDSEAKSLARARIPFYYGATGGSSTRPDYADLNGNDTDRLGIRDRIETVDQDIEIGADGGTETLTFEFNENIKDDFFVFKAVYSDGTRATYYIDAPKSSGGSSSVTADASNSDSSVDEGSTGTLNGDTSTSSTGKIDTYEWSFVGSKPDGLTINEDDTATPTATIDANGVDVGADTDVTVRLKVTNNKGDSDTATTTVTVRDTDGGDGGGNQPPSVAVNSATYSNSDDRLSVTFTPDDADGNLDTATIENGDGNAITASPIDVSGREGDTITQTFTVTSNNKPDSVEVTVTDTDGATGSGMATV